MENKTLIGTLTSQHKGKTHKISRTNDGIEPTTLSILSTQDQAMSSGIIFYHGWPLSILQYFVDHLSSFVSIVLMPTVQD